MGVAAPAGAGEGRAGAVGRAGGERNGWCRVCVSVSLVPPKPGQLISVSRGPLSVRVTVCLPRLVMAGLLVLTLGPHPWFGQVVRWARAIGGW